MTTVLEFLRRHAVRILAVVIILGLYGFTRLPELSSAGREALGARFAFEPVPLPEIMVDQQRSVRSVHPNMAHIAAWMSSVGASAALNDLDGDGRSNDVCYVDTRIDRVVIAPIPNGPTRYGPFALEPAPLPYDANTMAPMGCLPGDLNEDGLMDLVVYYWGRTPIAFLRAQDPGQPRNLRLEATSYVPREVAPNQGRWNTNAATLADLDGDGHVDLVIGNYFQDDALILDANAPDSGREQMQHSMSRALNAGRNRLLLWSSATAGAEPTVRFTPAEGVLDDEVAHGWTLALGAADLDGDLLPELYFANDFGPDRLLHNRSRPGQPSFARLSGLKGLTTPNSKVLGRDSFKGMGVDFGDLNADGLLDIYVSNIASEFSLEESHFVWVSTGEPDKMKEGIAPYNDRSEPLGLSRSGWGWESRLGDFDNDGVLEALQATGFVKGEVNRWPELHELAMGNDELLPMTWGWPRFQPGDDLSGRQHNPFFVRANDGRYYDLAPELGLDVPQVSRGIATGDVDRDGDLDFVVANQWETSLLYVNESPNPGQFLGLDLRLPVGAPGPTQVEIRSVNSGVALPGRPAIGASATVHLLDGRRLVGQVDGGNGHSGARSPELHFGLGRVPSDTALPVDLEWRDPQGHIHQETVRLSPGWHTVLLGQSGEGGG